MWAQYFRLSVCSIISFNSTLRPFVAGSCLKLWLWMCNIGLRGFWWNLRQQLAFLLCSFYNVCFCFKDVCPVFYIVVLIELFCLSFINLSCVEWFCVYVRWFNYNNYCVTVLPWRRQVVMLLLLLIVVVFVCLVCINTYLCLLVVSLSEPKELKGRIDPVRSLVWFAVAYVFVSLVFCCIWL